MCVASYQVVGHTASSELLLHSLLGTSPSSLSPCPPRSHLLLCSVLKETKKRKGFIGQVSSLNEPVFFFFYRDEITEPAKKRKKQTKRHKGERERERDLCKHTQDTSVEDSRQVMRKHWPVPNEACKCASETDLFCWDYRFLNGEKLQNREMQKGGGCRKGSKERRQQEQESRKHKARFLFCSTVVIRDECIVDIDLPCRTEPACSFLQRSFIIRAGQDSPSPPLRDHQLEPKLRLNETSFKTGCWDTAVWCCSQQPGC